MERPQALGGDGRSSARRDIREHIRESKMEGGANGSIRAPPTESGSARTIWWWSNRPSAREPRRASATRRGDGASRQREAGLTAIRKSGVLQACLYRPRKQVPFQRSCRGERRSAACARAGWT